MALTRNHFVGLFGFAVSATYWPGLLSPAFTPRWVVIAIGLPAIFTLDPHTLSPPLRTLLVLLVGLAAISLISSPDRLAGIYELFLIGLIALAIVAGSGLSSLDDLMRGMAAGLAVSALFALGQVTGLLSMPGNGLPSGLFLNSEIYAEFAAVILVWALVKQRFWLALPAAIPLVLCQSRIAVAAVIVGLAIELVRRRGWAWGIAVILLGMVFAACALFLLGYGRAASADHRLVLWSTTLMWLGWNGLGLGWFAAAFPHELYAHSDVLQALAELGPGAALLSLIPLTAFFYDRGHHAERAAFAAVCFEAVVSFPLHMPATALAAAMLAGFLVGVRPRIWRAEHVSGTDHGPALRWNDAAVYGDTGPGRPLGELIPLRSAVAAAPALRQSGDRPCRT